MKQTNVDQHEVSSLIQADIEEDWITLIEVQGKRKYKQIHDIKKERI